jgi:DNA-binding CsgD family transcriptional regulator
MSYMAGVTGALRLAELRKAVRQPPGATALVILDSSFSPVSCNAEAIRVLTYPRDPKELQSLAKHLEAKIRPLLAPLAFSRQSSLASFQSGRRQYSARMFALTSAGKLSVPLAAHALVLERRVREFTDLSSVAQKFHLTPREGETLRFLLEGMTSKEIANRMGISPHTVKAFLRLVMSKMQVSTRSGIVGKIVNSASD